jgi:restriction system protein
MARRRRQSTAEDVADAVALLPWWAGLMLAFASYFFFHWLAGRSHPGVTGSGQIAIVLEYGLVTGLAGALQLVAPLLCVAGATGSFLRRKHRARLVTNLTSSTSAGALNDMSWVEFEAVVAEAFRLQGFSVQERGGPHADGGVDLVARKGSEMFLVQCKQWRAFKVGVDVVRELYGVMAARGAAGGYVVTSGSFTAEASTFADGRNIRLIDGTKLFGLLQQARGSIQDRADVGRSSAPPARSPSPPCPVCDGAMILRTAKKGGNAGTEFWGCSTFPTCRGTRPLYP